MAAQRSDAVRSRERILAAAQGRDTATLRLNDLARDAGVGVGTVYRHFPTVRSLVESLTLDTLERLRDHVRAAAARPDSAEALSSLLRAALALQLSDGGLQGVLLATEDETVEAREMKREILVTFEGVLDRARTDGVVRPDITTARLQHLVCGIEHAVRLGEASEQGLFLDVLLAGLRPEGALVG